MKVLQPVEPETFPPAANASVPAEGDEVAFVDLPLDDTNDVSCQELPASDELLVFWDPADAAIDAMGVAGVVMVGAAEAVAEVDESELHAEASRAVIVNGIAIIRYLRLRCNMQSAYVSRRPNQCC